MSWINFHTETGSSAGIFSRGNTNRNFGPYTYTGSLYLFSSTTASVDTPFDATTLVHKSDDDGETWTIHSYHLLADIVSGYGYVQAFCPSADGTKMYVAYWKVDEPPVATIVYSISLRIAEYDFATNTWDDDIVTSGQPTKDNRPDDNLSRRSGGVGEHLLGFGVFEDGRLLVLYSDGWTASGVTTGGVVGYFADLSAVTFDASTGAYGTPVSVNAGGETFYAHNVVSEWNTDGKCFISYIGTPDDGGVVYSNTMQQTQYARQVTHSAGVITLGGEVSVDTVAPYELLEAAGQGIGGLIGYTESGTAKVAVLVCGNNELTSNKTTRKVYIAPTSTLTFSSTNLPFPAELDTADFSWRLPRTLVYTTTFGLQAICALYFNGPIGLHSLTWNGSSWDRLELKMTDEVLYTVTSQNIAGVRWIMYDTTDAGYNDSMGYLLVDALTVCPECPVQNAYGWF